MAAEGYRTQVMVIATLQSSSHRQNAELREVAITARGTDHKDYAFSVIVPNSVFKQLGEGNYIWAHVRPNGSIHSLQWTFPINERPTCEELHSTEIRIIGVNLRGCGRIGMHMVQLAGVADDSNDTLIVEFLASEKLARLVSQGGTVSLLVDSEGTARKIKLGTDTLTVIHL